MEQLTTARCREVAEAARRALETLGVSIPVHTDLGRQIADVEWMASFSADPLDERAGAYAANAGRATKAFLFFPQFQELVAGLRHTGTAVAANPDVIRSLRKRFDRLQTTSADAQNYLFELQIAGRLAAKRTGVRFDEPDVTAPIGRHGRVGFACKRAQNVDRVRERIGEGADQVRRAGRKGVVVVDVQPLLFPVAEDGRPTCKFYDREAEFVDHLARHVDGISAVVSPEIAAARAIPNVLGVIFGVSGWGLVDVRGIVAHLFAWVVREPGSPTAGERAARVALRGAPTSWETVPRVSA